MLRSFKYILVNKFQEEITGISNAAKSTPSDYMLKQNYPNPFNPITIISYSLPKLSFVELKVYDMLDREVSTLVNKEQVAGEYKIQFNASSLSSGIYIYTLQAEGYRASRKLIILK